MVFSSTVFLFLFFPILLVVYYNPFITNKAYRNTILLLCSLFFYAWGEPIYVFYMVLSIFITWLLVLLYEKTQSKIWCDIAVIFHILSIFVFKYLTFIVGEINRVYLKTDIDINIALPIGISFYTFQLMSYVFDVRNNKASAQHNFCYLAMYVSFFPQLVAGPIVRYQTIADQIENRTETKSDVYEGLRRFIYGLGKKILIADYMAVIADVAFGNVNNQSAMFAWVGAIAYTLQIYFDFSGYSDMAIGLGRIFGFRFEENFNYPYIAKNVSDFWKRWHISLSTWFKDYVYIPLGGNRVSEIKWIRNLLCVWLLTGIWHGANWTFLLWGLVYFVVLLLEKRFSIHMKINAGVYRILTLLIIIINWVIFRANSISEAFCYLGNMIGVHSDGVCGEDFIGLISGSVIIMLVAIIASTPLFKRVIDSVKQSKIPYIEYIWLVCIFVLSLIHAVASTYSPFIYFNF